MKSSQVTIKDIAKALNISASTVSRALKDHPDISPDTKKAVMDLADELNYQPNSIAQSLRKRHTNTIGVVIPEIEHFFFSAVISGIEDVAYKAGYNIIITQSNESSEREKQNLQTLFNTRVDGVIASVARDNVNYNHYQNLVDKGIALAFFDRVADEVDTHKVVVDDEFGAHEATVHLITEGYKRIAHLAGPANLTISLNRMNGYKRALNEYGIPIKDEHICICGEGTFEEAETITTQLLNSTSPPDALFANNDMAAYGAMKAIKKKGLSIPEDVAIVGFSNWRFASLIEPALSSVAQPGFEMGQEATRLLIAEINNQSDTPLPSENRILKTNLLVRESSKK